MSRQKLFREPEDEHNGHNGSTDIMGQAVNDILFTFCHSISFPIQINNSNIYKNEWMNDIVAQRA